MHELLPGARSVRFKLQVNFVTCSLPAYDKLETNGSMTELMSERPSHSQRSFATVITTVITTVIANKSHSPIPPRCCHYPGQNIAIEISHKGTSLYRGCLPRYSQPRI
jgi:hypothetical protein